MTWAKWVPRHYNKHRSSKPHDAPMGRRDIYFALDCEMVGVGPGGAESAVARVAVVNWEGDVILDRYVRPHRPVTDYRTLLSGVRAEDLERGDTTSPEACRKEVEMILRGKILIGHGVQNDLRILGLSHPWTDVRDTSVYAPFMSQYVSDEGTVFLPRKLRDLVWERLGLHIQDTRMGHSPIEDATSAMGLYKAVRMKWETAMQEEMSALLNIEEMQKQQAMARNSYGVKYVPVHMLRLSQKQGQPPMVPS